MKLPRLMCLLALAACNMANPLDGLNRSGTATANGHTFRVNWNLQTAQATRTDRSWRPDRDAVLAAAVAATENVTGCRVAPASVRGDVTLVNMGLDCARP